MIAPTLPRDFLVACRRHHVQLTRFILSVAVAPQRMFLWERNDENSHRLAKTFVISTSAFGIGQRLNSNQTPLGLHRIAEKIGGGQPIGTVFRSRQPVGLKWAGLPKASIVHRILWLEGLVPGFNRGGDVDSYRRYIYIHGFGDETTLGRPASHGCIHLAAKDLLPLYEMLPVHTVVWIADTRAKYFSRDARPGVAARANGPSGPASRPAGKSFPCAQPPRTWRCPTLFPCG